MKQRHASAQTHVHQNKGRQQWRLLALCVVNQAADIKVVVGLWQLDANSPKILLLINLQYPEFSGFPKLNPQRNVWGRFSDSASVKNCSKVGLQSNFTRLDICPKTGKANLQGIAVLTVIAITFKSVVAIWKHKEGNNFKGFEMLLYVFIQMISSYQTAMTDIYTLKAPRSLSSLWKRQTKTNKEKCKSELCDLPPCTQSGRWHAFHILFEKLWTSPNVDDRTYGGPKWESGCYMGQRQEDYRGQINGGSREAGILTWIATWRTHGATCI